MSLKRCTDAVNRFETAILCTTFGLSLLFHYVSAALSAVTLQFIAALGQALSCTVPKPRYEAIAHYVEVEARTPQTSF